MKKFILTVSGEVKLDVDDIWPDGDAPANPTAEDVLSVLWCSGRLSDVLADWNLEDDFDWDVQSYEV